MNFSEFLHMGGYAFYVWTSYAITFVVLLANVLAPFFHKRKLLKDLTNKARRARQQQ